VNQEPSWLDGVQRVSAEAAKREDYDQERDHSQHDGTPATHHARPCLAMNLGWLKTRCFPCGSFFYPRVLLRIEVSLIAVVRNEPASQVLLLLATASL
jgi:hypothetical protein